MTQPHHDDQYPYAGQQAHPQQPYPPQYQPPVPPPVKKASTTKKVLIGGAVFLVALIVIAGVSGKNDPAPASSAKTSAAPAVAAKATEEAATSPSGSFDAGTYEVGTGADQIAPGKYKSTGPDGSGICYFARLKTSDGSMGDIIANELSQGPAVMTVKASDGFVKISGCTFVKS